MGGFGPTLCPFYPVAIFPLIFYRPDDYLEFLEYGRV